MGDSESGLVHSRWGDTDIGPDHSKEHEKMLQRLEEDPEFREKCLRALTDE